MQEQAPQAGVRSERDLYDATGPFAAESVARSWWHVGSTFALTFAALAGAATAPWWPLQLALSVLGTLLMVRSFIAYHDYMHGAILPNSRIAWWLFRVYSAFMLTPPRSWRKSHNYHHGHVGKVSTTSIGTFPLITTRMWRQCSPLERAQYRIQRHPLVFLGAYVTVFAVNICLLPLREPAKHWDSALALAGHVGLIALLWILGGFNAAFFGVLLPMTLASAFGALLFFAQHSFKGARILSSEEWTFYRASLESSSYMRMNRVMEWFTGNIGYHHVHHLNMRIPFYRLPEAMAAIPELQSPVTISLSPRHIMDCFRASLWDEDSRRMVSYREASQAA